ncbi:hypothetical protein FOCC_FOCC015905 [Frankliniella occidentalis]|nr:hypothetical protein FOCC_FOCC015905 [Frankliniella occidentalis]
MICCSSFTDQPVVYKCAMHMMTEPDFLWNMVLSRVHCSFEVSFAGKPYRRQLLSSRRQHRDASTATPAPRRQHRDDCTPAAVPRADAEDTEKNDKTCA